MVRRWLRVSCCGLATACAGSPIESGSAGSIGSGNGDGDGTTTTDAESSGRDVTTQSSLTGSPGDSGSDGGDPSDPSDPSDPGDSGGPNPTDASSEDGSSGGSNVSGSSGESGNANDSAGDPSGDTDEPCDDADEPNEDYQESEPLGQLACNGGTLEHSASIEGATAPDWFYYAGVWDFDCGDGDGQASVTFTDGADLEFCLMATCHYQLGTSVGCTAGAPEGNTACCGSGTVSMNVNCSGSNSENADIDIIVGSPGAECRPFTFEYSY